MNEPTIFEFMYEDYKIKKPIRLIEFFAGYGSQSLALKYLGVDFTHWKICEWAIKSIQAYKDIHFTDVDNDFSFTFDLDEIKDFLLKKGISSNYNEPMNEKQIKRMSEKQARTIFNNIIATNNLVNIQQVKGKDLEIKDTDKYTYLLTYSFPCQDLSLAGKGKGMSDTSTRSGMLWEVERILSECKELGTMPEVLLMENVPQVHGTNNVQDFNKWRIRLEELGYNNYFEDLIATDYGIPQTRNRCFMVSVLGDYNYTFPPKQELKLRLKDMLEDNVDEKYYLSDKQIEDIRHWNTYEKPLENMEKIDKTNVSPTLTTRSGAYAAGMVLVKANMKTNLCNHLIKEGKVKENDVIRHSYTTSRINGEMKDLKQNNISPTLDTRCDCLGVCVKQKDVVTIGNYSPSGHNASRIVDKEYSAPTVMENHGTITATQTSDLRIRKLTPKECFRLQGVKDEDFENCAKNQSDASLYHLAGDSICVNVLMAIFKMMLKGSDK